jgi:hypothetical protein
MKHEAINATKKASGFCFKEATKETRSSVVFRHMQNTVRKTCIFCEGNLSLQIRKFADLNNLLDLLTFSKCGPLRICDLRTGTHKKFADLRKRNEPKNSRICELRTKKVCLSTLYQRLTVH